MTSSVYVGSENSLKPRVSKYIKEVVSTSETFVPKYKNSLLTQHSRPFIKDGILQIKANCACGKRGVILTFSDFLYSRTCGCGVKLKRLHANVSKVESSSEEVEPPTEVQVVSEVAEPKKRGRKPKSCTVVLHPEVDYAPKKRGRKPKNADSTSEEQKTPKKRGRKPKNGSSPKLKKKASRKRKRKLKVKVKIKPPRNAKRGIDEVIDTPLPPESPETYVYSTNSHVRAFIRSFDLSYGNKESVLFTHYPVCTSSNCNHPVAPSGRPHYSIKSNIRSKLTMVSAVYRSYGTPMAEFECSCGTTGIHLSIEAFRLRVPSCGCEKPSFKPKLHKAHQSLLTVTKDPFRDEDGRTYVICHCACGKQGIKISLAKYKYVMKSCGCTKRNARSTKKINP